MENTIGQYMKKYWNNMKETFEMKEKNRVWESVCLSKKKEEDQRQKIASYVFSLPL